MLMYLDMKKYILFLIFLVGLVFNQNYIVAQNIPTSEKEVVEELDKRGLSEEEVKNALLDKGIVIDDLENVTPQQMLEIEEIIKNLQEKKAEEKKEIISETEKKLPEKIEEEIEIEEEEPIIDDTVTFQIYGHNILRSKPKPKKDLSNINEDYILGAGDEISISIWSDYSQFDFSYVIDKDGFIKIDTRGIKKRIHLQGLSLAQSRKKLSNLLSSFIVFRSGEMKISLISSRNINVSVFGEVIKPGSFSIDATNTVFEGLKYSKGVSELGSVRKIKLIKPSGKFKIFDLYKFLSNPKYDNDFYLGNNDFIHVPVADKIIAVSGAIRRPNSFELIEGEGIKELITYAGGFAKDAIKDKILIERFEGNKKVYLEVNYKDLDSNFKLENGDSILVNKISVGAQNFVNVSGAVYNPGRYEKVANMTISDVLIKAGLKSDTKTNFAIILRENEDGTRKYISVNIDSILVNRANPDINIKLKNKDEITLWSKNRYSDKSIISIVGAVREPGDFRYGTVQSIDVLEAIELAGGTTRNASNTIIVHRQDPLKKYQIQYIKVDLDKIINNKYSTENIKLKAFDKLEVLSKNLFNKKTFVSISGAVNNPGEFQYGENMSLSDLIIMAGGFELSASKNNIEISRIIIKENKPTKVVVAKLDLSDIKTSESYKLEPYDVVIIRNIPEFEMQERINLTGQVKYPGEYTLISKNEKISDIIKRAGGFTDEAFIEGATLYRNLNETGFIVMRLNEAIKHKNSKYNYILKDKDLIKIPKKKDFVTIQGATKVDEVYKNDVASNKHGINVPYHEGKRAIYYINNYAGGISSVGNRNDIIVKHANGEVSKTINYGLFKLSPKVRKGSIIKVGFKKKKTKEEKDKDDVDWNKLFNDSFTQISAIMTLVVLFKSISQ